MIGVIKVCMPSTKKQSFWDKWNKEYNYTKINQIKILDWFESGVDKPVIAVYYTKYFPLMTEDARNLDDFRSYKEKEKVIDFIKRECSPPVVAPTSHGFYYCRGHDGKYKELDFSKLKVSNDNVDPYRVKSGIVETQTNINPEYEVYKNYDKAVRRVNLEKIFE